MDKPYVSSESEGEENEKAEMLEYERLKRCRLC